ncbi:hypothetical protein B296_00046647, partial [Ensete ventricosum]
RTNQTLEFQSDSLLGIPGTHRIRREDDEIDRVLADGRRREGVLEPPAPAAEEKRRRPSFLARKYRHLSPVDSESSSRIVFSLELNDIGWLLMRRRRGGVKVRLEAAKDAPLMAEASVRKLGRRNQTPHRWRSCKSNATTDITRPAARGGERERERERERGRDEGSCWLAMGSRLPRAIPFSSSERAIDQAVRYVFRSCDPKSAIIAAEKGNGTQKPGLFRSAEGAGDVSWRGPAVRPGDERPISCWIAEFEVQLKQKRIKCLMRCRDADESYQVLELRRIDYELWMKEPMSVDDRRKRFFRGMGFDELVQSPVGRSMDAEDSTIRSSEEKMDAKRIMTTGGVVLNSLSSPDVGEPADSFCCIKDLDSGRQFMVHEFGRDGFPIMFKEVGSEKLMTLQEFEIFLGLSQSVQKLSRKDVVLFREKTICNHDTKKSNYSNWWRSFTNRRQRVGASNYNVSVKKTRLTRSMRTKVHRYRKNCMDFTALYMGQEIQGHKGLIRTMKFSPSGRYLASGGEDCVIRIWQIIEAEDSCKCVATDGSSKFDGKVKGTKLVERKASNVAPVFIPKRIFKIEESPLLELRGHTSDILDLSWSQSNVSPEELPYSDIT